MFFCLFKVLYTNNFLKDLKFPLTFLSCHLPGAAQFFGGQSTWPPWASFASPGVELSTLALWRYLWPVLPRGGYALGVAAFGGGSMLPSLWCLGDT